MFCPRVFEWITEVLPLVFGCVRTGCSGVAGSIDGRHEMSTTMRQSYESSFLRVATHYLHNDRLNVSDGREKYLRTIYALPPLHWRETQKLLAECRKDPGNETLKNQIIEGNLFIVARTILSFVKFQPSEDFEDLLSEGYCGLRRGVDKFLVKFNDAEAAAFGRYVGYWILQFAKRYRANKGSTVRIPIQAQGKIRLLGNESSISFRASELHSGWYLNHLLTKQMDQYRTSVVSATTSRTLHQTIIDDCGCEDSAFEASVRKVFDVTPSQEGMDKRVVRIIHALCGERDAEGNKMTLEKLASELNCSKERVRQLRDRGFEHLRKVLLDSGFKSPADCEDTWVTSENDFLTGFSLSGRDFLVVDDRSWSRERRHFCPVYRPVAVSRPVEKGALICTKNMGYSFFTSGITIPVGAEAKFLKGMGENSLPMGRPHEVRVVVENWIFVAKAILPWTDASHTANINIKWCKQNPVIGLLRRRHPVCFSSVTHDRNYRNDKCVFSLYSTGEQGIFFLDDTPVEPALPPRVSAAAIPNGSGDSVSRSGPPGGLLASEASVPGACFSKPLDFSTFMTGITIPVRVHEAFLKHLSVKLERGQSHPVTIMVGDSSFQVSVDNIGFSDPNRKQILTFLWGKNSPLAKSFQATFPAAYRQLMEDHSNRDGIGTVLNVSCGEQPDVFQIDLGTPLVEFQEPDAPAQAETAAPAQSEASTPDVAPFITVLLRDFSAGFEFNDSSVRLLESAVGRSCPEFVRKELKRVMFKRYDGIFLLQEMVAEPETLAELKQRIEEYFSQYHAFSLSVLYDEFADRLSALTNPDSDFRLFLLNAILPELPEGGDIFGRQQKQICIPGSSTQREILEFLAEQFREKLRENGDAVLMDELLAELPCLNFAAAEDILREQIPDAVEIKMDGLQYWKLLESFCLPEDFGEILGQIIGGIEQQGKIPSLQAVATGLEVQYGSDFREIYALDDDEVFRQVIFKSIGNGDYTWKNNLLVKRAEKRETNVADEFLQTRHGIFEETEFFDYAAQHRGLTNTSTLLRAYLRPNCIRLDAYHWLGLADFENLADFTAETAAKMTRLLKSRLAHQLFLPLGTLPDAFYSELPPIHIQARPFYWNEYLLASVAEHKLHALQVVNTEPSPYTVTAMVLPDANDYDGDDVIGFVFRALRRASRRFDSADQVFEYLKEHKVRMFRTKQLMERINSFWGLA